MRRLFKELGYSVATHLVVVLGIAAFYAGYNAMAKQPDILRRQQVIEVSLISPPPQDPKPVEVRKEVIKPVKIPAKLKPKIIEHKPVEKVEAPHEENIALAATEEVAKPAVISQPVFDAAYLNNPPPDYPAAAKRKNIEGKVLLKVTVNEEGRAVDVGISSSSGADMLDEAALAAVRKWKFVPAKRGGEAVVAVVTVPVVFKLR